MWFFCGKCGEEHRFEPQEVERIVYALQAENGCEFDKDVPRRVVCLNEALYTSHEPELYLEWVDGLVEARRTGRRKAKQAEAQEGEG